MHPVFHVSLLKRAVGDVEPRAPVFRDDSDEPEFEVKKILAKRLAGNKGVEYQVLWKGYPPFDATWEPASNLSNAQQLIDEFEQSSARTRK